MFVSIVAVVIGLALSITSAFTFWPVHQWFDFYRPLVLFIAGYFAGIGACWVFLDITGRIMVSYKKNYNKPSKTARFLLNDGIGYINNHANIKVKKIGLDKLPSECFLMIGNHKSKFDSMLVSQVLANRDLAFVTKQDNMKIPLAARFMWRNCYMPVDRDDKLQSLEQFKKAADLISNGYSSVGIYPEGSRQNADVILGDFHNGAFSIATRTKCPIVILTMKGTSNIHKRFPKRTVVEMKVVQVLYYEDYSSMNATELCNYVHDIMYKELSQPMA